MERSVSEFVETLSSFLSEVESTTRSLAGSIQQRPIPLDSAASSFLQRLDAQVSAAAVDLERLESMAFGTVSFAELLGHCSEVYKVNQGYIADLEERLKGFGYVPEEVDNEGSDFALDVEVVNSDNGLEKMDRLLDLSAQATENVIEVDDIFVSMSLQNLGLSDACLATLASEDKDDPSSPDLYLSRYANGMYLESKEARHSIDIQKTREKLTPPVDSLLGGKYSRNGELKETTTEDIITISKGEYDIIPSYMKSLTSWEDMVEAVNKINSELRNRKNGSKNNISFNADDVENFGLGRKGRSYLLLLLKMNKLIVEMEGGAVIYRVVVET